MQQELNHIQTQLIQNQLLKEYESILWQYQIPLKPAFIELTQAHSYWGMWYPLERTIKISQKLIQNKEWDFVIHILKHEIAHQIVSEIDLQLNHGHGEYFQKACQRLALPQMFRKSQLELDSINEDQLDVITNQSDEDLNRLKKVEKLLSLSQSSNENEALLAMKLVYEIYEKYNLSRLENFNQKNNYISILIKFNKTRMQIYQTQIASLLESHYFVRVILTNTYNPKKLRSEKALEILGLKENVKMAEYVFVFLNQKLLDLWQSYSEIQELPAKFKRSYMIGIISGFSHKLNELKKEREKKLLKENINKKSILSLRNDPGLESYFKEKLPKVHIKSTPQNGIYNGIYADGAAEGSKIIIHKGVSSNSHNLKIEIGSYNK